MKNCLIGYGYWGKIIHKNLMSLPIHPFLTTEEVDLIINSVNTF